MRFILILFTSLLSQWSLAEPRTVMVQLFEWPWKDVARECEQYLGPAGFAAVQVSPPHEHIRLGQNFWWERYQLVSYKLQSRSGNEVEFQDMVQRCKAAGVDIYVDAVLNHTVGQAQGVGFAGTPFVQYNHPGIYGFDDFHHCGRNGNDKIINFNDRYEVQFCELLGLSDLKTESPHVQATLADYLNSLLAMGVRGFRMDAAKHIPAADFYQIFQRLIKIPYIIFETFIGQGEPVQISEYTPLGDVNFFQYAFDVGGAFTSGSLPRLMRQQKKYIDSDAAVVLLENHDLERMESTTLPNRKGQHDLWYLAHVFMLTWPYGYPQIFSGYDFTDYNQGPPVDSQGFTRSILTKEGHCESPWTCAHREPSFAALAQFRNFTNEAFSADSLTTQGLDRLSFSRGQLGHVIINLRREAWQIDVPSSMKPGVYCNILDASYDFQRRFCSSGISVGKDGRIQAALPPTTALVLQANILAQVPQ